MTLRKDQTGYTLIELMVVVAIIGILGAIAIPGYIGYRLRAERSVAWTDLQALRLLEEQFYAENNFYAGPFAVSNPNGAAIRGPNATPPGALPGFQPDQGSLYDYSIAVGAGATTFTARAARRAGTSNDVNAPYTIDNNNNRAALGAGCLAGACW